jgi:succinate dehydrogenase / fumarate reductase iron-sulfur subunit
VDFRLRIWRQASAAAEGRLVDYQVSDIAPDTSFLEMMDVLNEDLVGRGEQPVAFDHDCREGICGSCAMVINGVPHGPEAGATTCQVYMRQFQDGDEITVEPFRAQAFPLVKDLVVDRSALDRLIEAGGYVSVNTGAAPDANAVAVDKDCADLAFEAAACIGCGACIAACPNASAMLFLGAKVNQYALLPQGQPERTRRVLAMSGAMDSEGFGNCSNHYECSAVCPKEIPVRFIARLNREFLRAALRSPEFAERPIQAEYEDQ